MVDGETSYDSLSSLDLATIRFYHRVVDLGVFDPQIMELEYGATETRRMVQQLSQARLLYRLADEDRVAVSRPDVAASRIIRPLEANVREMQERINRIAGEFSNLMTVYESAARRRNQQHGSLDMITDLGEADCLIRERAGRAHTEILAMHGGGPQSNGMLEPILCEELPGLSEGVRICVLHQHSARYDPTIRGHVEAITSFGGQVRTIEKLWNHIYVFDREFALMFGDAPEHSVGVVVVDQALVAASVTALFEQTWSLSKPFEGRSTTRSEGVYLRDDVRRAIMYFLAEGLRDESIARRIGVSVRTCRRHIAEILAEMGAETRFQAGYLCARRGGSPGRRSA